MPQAKTWLKTDLSKPITVYSLENEMFTLDNQGNLIGVEVYDNGEPVNLTGTIIGYIIRSDGDTVYVEGEISGNTATIVLPAVAYAVIGQITIVIRCINGDQKTVIAACKAHVTRSRTDEVIDPGEVIPSIEDLPVHIIDVTTYYQASDNGTTIPTGTWSTTIPTVLPGKFLWQKEVLTWNTDQTTEIYTVTRYGVDGEGAVSGVEMNGQTYSPDAQGIVDIGTVFNDYLQVSSNTPTSRFVAFCSPDASDPSKLIVTTAPVYTTQSITAASGSWSSATPPTQTISVTGVTDSNLITVSPASDITAEQLDALAAAKIICTAQGSGTITLTCYGTEPSVNIPLLVTIMG